MSTNLTLSSDELLRLEMLDLLYDFYLLRRLWPTSESAVENIHTMHLIAALTNAAVLRLWKLRDRDKRNIGFEQLVREIAPDRAAAILSKVARYRDTTDGLADFRHTYVAHRAIEHAPYHFAGFAEIRGAILLALDITDDLRGERAAYRLSETVDLRHDIEAQPPVESRFSLTRSLK